MKFGLSQVIESHRQDVRTVKRSIIQRFSSKYERRLLALCKNNPNNDSVIEKWNKTAVKFLINKFKKNIAIIEELEKAISLECSSTKCISCTKTPVNRLQVSHRSVLPHVIYCRLWRWPDLQSHHQIKAIRNCDNYVEDNSVSSDTVCVNPYHYDRQQPASIDPVLVPCNQIPPDLSTSYEDSDSTSTINYSKRIMLPTIITGETVRSMLSLEAPTSTSKPEMIARPYQFKRNRFTPPARAMHEQNFMGQPTSYEPQRYPIYNQQTPAQYEQQQSQTGYPMRYVQQQNSYAPQQMHTAASSSYQQQQVHHPQHQIYGAEYSPQQEQYQPQEQYINQEQYNQSEHMQLDYPQEFSVSTGFQHSGYYEPVAGPSRDYNVQPIQKQPATTYQMVPYVEEPRWCSISYHEFAKHIGSFQSMNTIVSVDGFTHPNCSDRFCVGGLSNVTRDEVTESVRRRIGKGIKLTFVDKEVYVECLSDASVFIASPMLQEGVAKITSGTTVKAFSNPQFRKLLSDAVSKGFEEVYKLTGYCKFRISFVKGWGRFYRRQTISESPCWIEVQLNGPLQWIDDVLRQMKPPQGCGSTS